MEETAWLETILKKFQHDKSISRVLNVDMVNAVPAGENYASIIYRAKLDVIQKSGCRSNISLILKKADDKTPFSKELPVFKTEMKVYIEILEKFDQLMNDYQDNRDKLWCNMIGCKQNKLLVFDDLKKENFQLANRKDLLDKNHSLLVLHSLGRFHAMGYKLIQDGQIAKADTKIFYLEEENSPVIRNLIVGGLMKLSETMENSWPAEWKDVAKRLAKQKPVILSKLKALFTPPEDAFITVCHGDCWSNNMMFKYCPYDETIPVAVKFLDYQATHINSYAFDIIYFLYISVHPEIRKNHLDDLIAEYMKSLKSTLAIYNLENHTPSLEHIFGEIKRLQYFAMAMNLIYLPVTCAENAEAIKVEHLDGDCNGMDTFGSEIFHNEKYKLSVEMEIGKWMEEGLL